MNKRLQSLLVFLAIVAPFVLVLFTINSRGTAIPTNIYPNLWYTNWSENATNITLPISSVEKLNATQADGATGDIRQVLYGILYEAQAAAAAATGDGITTKMTINKNTRYDQNTGEAIVTFSVSFRLTNTVTDVVGE